MLVRTLRNWTFIHCWWEWKMVQLLWKTVWQFLKKLNKELLYDPAIPLLDTDSKELKVKTLTDICTPMFTALFTSQKVETIQIFTNRRTIKMRQSWPLNNTGLRPHERADAEPRIRRANYGLKHLWISVYQAGPGTNPPRILRDRYT